MHVGKVQSATKYTGLVKTKTTRHLLRDVADVTFTCDQTQCATRETSQAKQTHKTYKSSSRAQRSAANTRMYVYRFVYMHLTTEQKKLLDSPQPDRDVYQTNGNKRNSRKAKTTTKRERRAEQLHTNWRVCKI